MRLDTLTIIEVEKARLWRNVGLESLRTPYMLTKEMQSNFYNETICNRDSRNKFFALRNESAEWSFIGMLGLINIEWENSLCEISMIIDPSERCNGYGEKAIELLLTKGFLNMNINTIYGECYKCNSALNFWEKIIKKYNADIATLKSRKYYNGNYYDSLYFSISKESYLSYKTEKIKQ